MRKVLIISSSQQATDALAQIINSFGAGAADSADSGGSARRRMIETDYDLLVINTPLSDETGINLAADMSMQTEAGIILLVPADRAELVWQGVEDYGVFVVSKPINKQWLYQAMKFITASRKRLAAMKRRQTDLQQKMEDLKVINRAKCCLIQYLNMTEKQAHRYIEKQAMDMRTGRRGIAEDILKTYES